MMTVRARAIKVKVSFDTFAKSPATKKEGIFIAKINQTEEKIDQFSFMFIIVLLALIFHKLSC